MNMVYGPHDSSIIRLCVFMASCIATSQCQRIVTGLPITHACARTYMHVCALINIELFPIYMYTCIYHTYF